MLGELFVHSDWRYCCCREVCYFFSKILVFKGVVQTSIVKNCFEYGAFLLFAREETSCMKWLNNLWLYSIIVAHLWLSNTSVFIICAFIICTIHIKCGKRLRLFVPCSCICLCLQSICNNNHDTKLLFFLGFSLSWFNLRKTSYLCSSLFCILKIIHMQS